MKKIKKILLTAVAMTMLASTAASAYTMEQAAAEDWGTTTVTSTKTNNEVLIDALTSNLGLDAKKLTKVTEIVNALPTISNAQADKAIQGMQDLLDYTKDMTNDEIYDSAATLATLANNSIGAALGVYFDANSTTKVVTIKDRTEKGMPGKVSYGSMTVSEITDIKGDQSKETLITKISDKKVQQSLASAIVAVSGDNGGNKATETVSVWSQFSDEEKQAYVDAKTKAEELEAILAKGEKDNGADLAAKMAEFKKIVADMPDGELKTALQKSISDYEAKYGTFKEGETYVLNENAGSISDAITNGANNASGSTSNNKNGTFQATNGSLKKTATNSGNMAVAGLAMIAVAGTVFVVSKKKIAE